LVGAPSPTLPRYAGEGATTTLAVSKVSAYARYAGEGATTTLAVSKVSAYARYAGEGALPCPV
jgi:hypothetical protein